MKNITDILAPKQKESFDKFKDSSFHGLISEYGTGKTVMAIAYILHHIEKNNVSRILIIAKKNNIMTSTSTWQYHLKKYTHIKPFVILGSVSKKRKLLSLSSVVSPSIDLVNYEGIMSVFPELLSMNYDLVIFDEANKLKNPKTKHSKKAIKLADTISYKLICAGEILTENLMEVWGPMRVLSPEILGKSYFSFLLKYFHATPIGYKPRKNAKKSISKKIYPYCTVFRLRDCWKLPSAKHIYHPVSYTDKQKKLVSSLIKNWCLEIPENKISIKYKYMLQIRQKLQQIMSGFVYHNSTAVSFPTNKDIILNNIITYIRASSEKVIIWCNYIEEADHVHRILPSSLLIKSTDSIPEITLKIRFFKNSSVKYPILILTYGFYNSGETLVNAKYTIFYGYADSNDKMSNAHYRNYRKGSEIHDIVYRHYIYVKDSIEEIILKNRRRKKQLQIEIYSYIKELLEKQRRSI